MGNLIGKCYEIFRRNNSILMSRNRLVIAIHRQGWHMGTWLHNIRINDIFATIQCWEPTHSRKEDCRRRVRAHRPKTLQSTSHSHSEGLYDRRSLQKAWYPRIVLDDGTRNNGLARLTAELLTVKRIRSETTERQTSCFWGNHDSIWLPHSRGWCKWSPWVNGWFHA